MAVRSIKRLSDPEKLDRAIDAMLELVESELSGSQGQPQLEMGTAKMRIDAAKALGELLARKHGMAVGSDVGAPKHQAVLDAIKAVG